MNKIKYDYLYILIGLEIRMSDDNEYKSIEVEEPEYVKELDPLYQQARRSGAIDMVLNFQHTSGTLEGAEKVVSSLVSRLYPMLETFKSHAKDPEFHSKLRRAAAGAAAVMRSDKE